MPQTISPLDILTSGGKYPEREKSDECTSEVRANAADLAERVSRLLDHLGVEPAISSGFRTTTANRKAGGSRLSAHCEGRAVDLEDSKGELSARLVADPDLLVRFDLYLENPFYTKTWTHLQSRPTLSGRRIFTP